MERLTLIKNQLNLSPTTPTATYTYPKLSIDIYDENIGVISLNSPKDLNSLSNEMRQNLVTALKQLEKDPKIKVVVIQSKLDKFFCVGANINEFQTLSYESQIQDDFLAELSLALDKFKKPLIAAVNGGAYGGGLELALACDVIICSDDAKLGLPEVKLGVIPGFGGTQRLYRILGKYHTMQMIMLSEPITGTMAKNLGLAVAVYNKEDVNSEALKFAKELSDKSLLSLIMAKETMKKADDFPLAHGLQYERLVFSSLIPLKPTQEGVSAFLQKRTPNFKDL